MKFKLYIQGYADDSSFEAAKFKISKRQSKNYLGLFVSQSDFKVKVGEKIHTIKKGDILLKTDLEIKAVNFGYGEQVNYIPVGYKSLILVKGDVKDISLLKLKLEKVSGWGQSSEDFVAINE